MNRTINLNPVQQAYERHLKKIAAHVGVILPRVPTSLSIAYAASVDRIMRKYANLLEDWAISTAGRVLQDVETRNAKHWFEVSRAMGQQVARDVRGADLAPMREKLLREQVELIRSIPIDAAVRVNELTLQALSSGARHNEIANEIQRTSEVSRSKAILIARTEIGRASTSLTQARTQAAGSTGYIWRTAGDGTVRPSHKAMSGQFVRWDSPPTLDNLTGHAGCVPNCRCFPEVVFED